MSPMVTVHDVRALALSLPRTQEHLIRDHVKFRVGRIVYAAISPDETIMGFGFPREERAAGGASAPRQHERGRRHERATDWLGRPGLPAWPDAGSADRGGEGARVVEGPDDGQRLRPGQHLCGDRAHLVMRDRLDRREDLVDRLQPGIDEL